MMEYALPTPADHCRVQILAFRKVFGLICIGQYNGLYLNSSFASSPNLSPNQNNFNQEIRRSSVAKMASVDADCSKSGSEEDKNKEDLDPEAKQMNILKQEYQKLKQEFNDQLVDSRCVLFGFSSSQNSTEILSFPRSDDISLLYDQLEACTRDLLRSIYVVLDSKRLDTSFERMDSPPYILLQEEEKYLMGIDNVKSKNHKKKCIGRLRKRLADYAFLTGYFDGALNSYHSAIELLKSTQDLLWLAAAAEGWCCAAMMIKYSQHLSPYLKDSNFNSPVLRHETKLENRISNNAITASNSAQHHSRYRRSDDAAKISINQNACAESDNESSTSSSSTFIGNKSYSLAEERRDDKLGDSKQDKQQHLLNNIQPLKNKNLQILSPLDSTKTTTTSSMLPSPLGMSSAFKSSSVQNLSNIPTLNINGKTTTTAPPISSNKNPSINRNEIFEKFSQSLENYARYSFAVHIEYECMMRAVHLQVVNHQYVEVEAFLREQTCRFLDDKFVTFNNIMKSHICLATADIYRKIGFKRKFAFFLRLAVFFRLYMENQSEAEYKKVYPYLNESLSGYRIDWRLLSNSTSKKSLKAQFLTKLGSSETFSLQIKAVHEVFTVAMRAGFYDIATRHLCFMLEAFFDHLDKATSLALVEELTKLNYQNKKGQNLHDLEKPITLDSVPSVLLPPLQFTKFPIIKDISILPLAEHLSPSIHPSSSNQSSIFIYSPFQQTFKEDIYWVVGCHSGISIQVENPLPIELIVDNLKLIVEGCDFEPLFLRLNLPSCYGPCIDQTKNLVKLMGIPRSKGTLKIVGYSCELLGCRNICKFSQETSSLSNFYSVRILPNLPLLRIETSLKRSPTLFENPNEAIAELCVFSGQSFPCKLTLYNSSSSVGIKRINIKIQQPQVAAGTKLLRIDDQTIEESSNEFDLILYDLKAGERREISVQIFGIDATTATPLDNISQKSLTTSGKTLKFGEEQKVYIRRPTSSNLTTTIISDSDLPLFQLKEKEIVQKSLTKQNKQQQGIQSTVSTPLLKQTSDDDNISTSSTTDSTHHHHYDLIPYTGRLLMAEVAFTYTADLETENSEQYIRFAKLPLAITIVPAVNVSNWQVLAGDGPFSRYVAIDLSNQTENEAQLNFGSNNKKTTIVVQPKEICRVPLLCPCCTEIKSISFQRVTKCASYIMQMQEIALLRSQIEKHLLNHLEINWRIEQLNLNGQVPVGSLLSSVSFLRQMALPTLTIALQIDNQTNQKTSTTNINDFNVVQVGEIVCVSITIYFSIGGTLKGELSLGCYQNFQNNTNNTSTEHPDKFFIFGPNTLPVEVEGLKEEEQVEEKNFEEEKERRDEIGGHFSTKICFAFCFEGIYKIFPKFEKIQLFDEEPYSLNNEDIFMTALSFSVINK
uniref:Trafficking protein particle complex subunit 11 domain-containing protein n=1 Tax=Meloidogyne hapla TaxID=6305 RepID=A0A1I8AW41_MELHA